MKKVVIYTTEYCGYCSAAKELLKSKNVEFEEIDVTKDSQMRTKLVELTGGRTMVPQIFVDDKSIGGYKELAQIYEDGETL